MLRQSNLKGIQIPGHLERLVTTLFADDTTVFVDSSDDYNHLVGILDRWCAASGAKFNVSKTEIIPTGSPAYRESLASTRSIHPDQAPIPQGPKINKDGESSRMLGARQGNLVNPDAIWVPITNRMESILDRLQSTHPTLESAKHIVRNTIASFTEYFVRIGETLGPRAKTLEKLQRHFIWNNAKVPPLSYDQLSQETNDGGKKFFNIHHRNDAIALMHL
ncbi:hypothetical protein K435DRAFT_565837, partial [Dendrothele bispora CBS 962.96]